MRSRRREELQEMYIKHWAGGHLRGCPRAIPDLCSSLGVCGKPIECECDQVRQEEEQAAQEAYLDYLYDAEKDAALCR